MLVSVAAVGLLTDAHMYYIRKMNTDNPMKVYCIDHTMCGLSQILNTCT